MRVYFVEPDTPSIATTRVRQAFERYAPDGVVFTSDAGEADLRIIPAIGRRDRVRRHADAALRLDQDYAVLQYCLRSTLEPHTSEWADIWSEAVCVWSYYDLRAWCYEDATDWPLGNRFYHAPLGVDGTVFTETFTAHRPYVVCSSGRAWLTEGARECSLAAQAVGRESLHLGPMFKSRPWVRSVSGVTDTELAGLYSQCDFVSGLRRVEGFEMPVIEGVLCGARPVVFDQPHYRTWFGEFAEFIPERPRPYVLADLTELFANGARPVTDDEKALVRMRFNWKTLMKGFWERL